MNVRIIKVLIYHRDELSSEAKILYSLLSTAISAVLERRVQYANLHLNDLGVNLLQDSLTVLEGQTQLFWSDSARRSLYTRDLSEFEHFASRACLSAGAGNEQDAAPAAALTVPSLTYPLAYGKRGSALLGGIAVLV